jgi:hypothetical protein
MREGEEKRRIFTSGLTLSLVGYGPGGHAEGRRSLVKSWN